MARKIIEADYEVDMNENQSVASEKLPSSMNDMGRSNNIDVVEIPCQDLIPFQDKQGNDFSSWDETRFEELKESIREFGVIEPIIVRKKEGESKLEILAGEHRWKACKELDIKKIPARVRPECNDEDAFAIFTLTNIMRRESTLKDKVYGCWLYTEKTKYKRKEEIERLKAEGVITEGDEEWSKKNISRYSKLHKLPNVFFQLLENNVISIQLGVEFAGLDEEQFQDLEWHKDSIKKVSDVKAVLALARGEVAGLSWSDDSIKKVLENNNQIKEPSKKTFTYVTQRAKVILKDRIPPEKYEDIDSILEEALSLYFEWNK